jgi:hypothetical protein
MNTPDQTPSDVLNVPTYYQHEQWFEVKRNSVFILIISSEGKLRKLFTEEGGYEDVN